MAINDATRVYAGFTSLPGGMNAGQSPDQIGADQCAYAENITFRGGIPRTRPAFINHPLSFPGESVKNGFNGNPQGIIGYRMNQGEGSLLVVSGGRMFSVEVSTWEVIEVTPEDGVGDPDIPQVWMLEAEDYVIIQDGLRKPIIFDGGTARFAAEEEVPIGGPMAYGLGRLWVARGEQVFAGDIRTIDPSSILRFTETEYLAEGGSFTMPTEVGPVMGMAFIPVLDTSTGQGPLYVAGKAGAATLEVGIPRASWKETNIQKIALLNIGTTSDRSLVLMNGDLVFRSWDGIRSYRMARSELGLQGRRPFSAEVSPYVDSDAPIYLKYTSSVFFDGRLLTTTRPHWRNTYCTFGALAVWDTSPTNTSRTETSPCWDGLWTGRDFVDLTSGVFGDDPRCFALCRDSETGSNQIVEITKGEPFDDGAFPIPSVLETGAFDFGNALFPVQLFGADVWMGEISGTFEYALDFRPYLFPAWAAWHRYSTCAAVVSCDGLIPLSKQYRRLSVAGPHMGICDPLLKTPLAIGNLFQMRFSWNGHAALNMVRLSAKHRHESLNPGTEGTLSPVESPLLVPL